MGIALDRFRTALPAKPYCTNDFGYGLKIQDRACALGFRNIQLSQSRKHYLCFDLDYEGAAFGYENADLPPPTITVINPKNAHCHALYELSNPVLFPYANGAGKALPRPQAYYRRIREAMNTALSGDPAYSGLLTKNPFHPSWHVIENYKQYELDELRESCERFFAVPDGYTDTGITENALKGRNCLLFDESRFLGYDQVKNHPSLTSFRAYIYDFCFRQNQTLRVPLPESEIRSISKSVSNWIWKRRERFTGEGYVEPYNRGAMGFPPIPSGMDTEKRKELVTERKKQGAEYCHARKRERTAEKIEKAIESLHEQGKDVTGAAIAREAGISRPAVQRYFKRIAHLQDLYLSERVDKNPFLKRKFAKGGFKNKVIRYDFKCFIS